MPRLTTQFITCQKSPLSSYKLGNRVYGHFSSRIFFHTMAAELQQTFLQIPHFAVVGASKDQNKWGTKILKWYQTRGLDVIPVHYVRNAIILFF